MLKRTADLEPGDVLLYADMTDTVVRVELPDNAEYPQSIVATVHVKRCGRRTHFHCGILAVHEVHTPEEAKA